MTDREMEMHIANVAGGDMSSLKALYEELRAPLYKFTLSILSSPDSAEDAAQETFIRVKQSAHTYRRQGKPRAWIFTIARNLALSEFRASGKYDDYEALGDIPSETDFDIEGESKILDILKGDEKEIVSLHVLGGLKHSDIASATGIPYEQVRWKYAYAIKKLKIHLTKEGIAL